MGLQAALCALLGSGAGYAYVVLLQQQVDSVSPTDAVPIWEAEDNVQGFARPFAIAIAAYRRVTWACSIILMHCLCPACARSRLDSECCIFTGSYSMAAMQDRLPDNV